MHIVGIDVGLRNLALCCIDDETGAIVHWDVLDVLKDKKAKSVSIEKSVELLLEELKTLPWLCAHWKQGTRWPSRPSPLAARQQGTFA